MEKTTYYQLNKPEVHDPLRVEDFNENADIIDAAMGALNATVARMVKPNMAIGTYKGTDVCGSANKNSLTFDFEPKIVGIVVDAMDVSNNGAIFVRGQSKSSGIGRDALDLTVSWSGNTVFWYADSAATSDQLNSKLYNYYYFAIG